LAIAAGVALGALAVDVTAQLNGHTELAASDFAPTFLAIGAISALSIIVFARLPVDAGAELSGRIASEPAAAGKSQVDRI
jgi:hypothetical protein